jgi:type II secretory pathway component HofQ
MRRVGVALAAVLGLLVAGATTDEPPRSVRIDVRFVEAADLTRRDAQIRWARADATLRVGITGEIPDVAAGSRRLTTRRRADAFVVVQDGSEAFVATGTATTVTRWFAGFARGRGSAVAEGAEVTTGFAVRPRIQADGRVLLEITPKASYWTDSGPGAFVVHEARTTVAVAPGETLVLAGGGGETGRAVDRFLSGLAREERDADWAMTCRVAVVK